MIYYLHISLVKLDKVGTLYLAAEYNRFELFSLKKEMDYNESMEIPIVTEVDTIIVSITDCSNLCNNGNLLYSAAR